MFKLLLACHRFRDVSKFRKHYWFKYIRPKSNPQLAISNLTKKNFNCHFISLWRKATALITLDHLPGYVHNDPVLKLPTVWNVSLSIVNETPKICCLTKTFYITLLAEKWTGKLSDYKWNNWLVSFIFSWYFVFTIRTAACRVKGFWYLSPLKEIKYNGLLLNMHVAIDCSLS